MNYQLKMQVKGKIQVFTSHDPRTRARTPQQQQYLLLKIYSYMYDNVVFVFTEKKLEVVNELECIIFG